jgi:hypothetical protein
MSTLGTPAQYANFAGVDECYDQFTFVSGGSAPTSVVNFGFYVAGHGIVSMSVAGDKITWTPESGRINGAPYDRLDVYMMDYGGGAMTVHTTGATTGVTSHTVPAGGSTGLEIKHTLNLTADTYSVVEFEFVSGAALNISGMGFWSSTSPAVQIFNLGVGGAESSLVNYTTATGTANMLSAAVNRGATLALIDFGINDILHNFTTLAATITNLTNAATTLMANGIDVVFIIPHPFQTTTGVYTQAQLITAMQGLATSRGVGVLDLNSTYANNGAAFEAVFGASGPHPNATGYDDFGARIASALTGVNSTYPNSASYAAAHPMTNIPPGSLV